MKKKIYNFNHIDKNLTDEIVQKYMEWYKYYHRLFVCYQWKYKKLTRTKLVLDMSGIGLTFTGAVVGGVTLNPIVLGVITGSGVLIQTYTIKSGLERKGEQCRFAYTSYQKILTQIRGFLRGTECQEPIFLSHAKILNDIIVDLSSYNNTPSDPKSLCSPVQNPCHFLVIFSTVMILSIFCHFYDKKSTPK